METGTEGVAHDADLAALLVAPLETLEGTASSSCVSAGLFFNGFMGFVDSTTSTGSLNCFCSEAGPISI